MCSGKMLQPPEYLPLYLDLYDKVKRIGHASNSVQAALNTLSSVIERAAEPENRSGTLDEALTALIELFIQALDSDVQYVERLAEILAEATRQQPTWRSITGICCNVNDLPNSSILHVAMSFEKILLTKSQSLLRDCLRILANSCADDNVNRSIVIKNGILGKLISVAVVGVELDTLIPTLYNICNDYIDPYESTKPSTIPNKTEPQTEVEEDQSIPDGAVQLARSSHNQYATFEILLSLTSLCSDDRKGYLAELVEMATMPINALLKDSDNHHIWSCSWSFKLQDQKKRTLTLANQLADFSTECRVHILRAILYLLSNELACENLLADHDEFVLDVVQLASSSKGHDVDEDAEYDEEMEECRKQFLKSFYVLTGLPGFTAPTGAPQTLFRECIGSLSSYSIQDKSHESVPSKPGIKYLSACSLIILAQLASLPSVREQLLAQDDLKQILSVLMTTEDDNDVLYPAVILISRLAISENSSKTIAQAQIIQPMARMLQGQGRGLVVPFEIISAYRTMVRNQPNVFLIIAESRTPDEDSVVNAIFNLFDKTIEAGTKLEVGRFVIEILRTMFSHVKDLDRELTEGLNPLSESFSKFLAKHGKKVSEVLSFVCTSAEPQEQRVHGWFGLGMFSVWKQGRSALLYAIEEHGLGPAMLEVAKLKDGPAPQNLKLLLSKMQDCSAGELSAASREFLDNASKDSGLDINF